MKASLILIYALFDSIILLTCISGQNSGQSSTMAQKPNQYKVIKIDSINDYYQIYAKKEGSVFKIISKKQHQKDCDQIQLNKFYVLQLHSILTVNGKRVIPANQIYEISGWRIDESTTISFEGDSIRDLFAADLLKGLCLEHK